jgi:hypothetical protein
VRLHSALLLPLVFPGRPASTPSPIRVSR